MFLAWFSVMSAWHVLNHVIVCNAIGTNCVCVRKTYSIVHIYHLSTHIFIWSSPVWLFLLRFFPSAGSCSLFTGGWDNNVKYLKAELEVQEDKNPGSQDLTDNTSAASVCGHSYLLTHHRDKLHRCLCLLRLRISSSYIFDRPGCAPCPFPSLPWWRWLAPRWWLRLSCSHPWRSCKPLQMLSFPITGQYPGADFKNKLSDNICQVTEVIACLNSLCALELKIWIGSHVIFCWCLPRPFHASHCTLFIEVITEVQQRYFCFVSSFQVNFSTI